MSINRSIHYKIFNNNNSNNNSNIKKRINYFNITTDNISIKSPVKSAAINFLSNGKSKGTGQVIFIRSNDTRWTINKYNNVELDGRPMKIEVELSLSVLKQ
ncbi:hypothetical protein H8356DRAFT_923692 [Neocallimastix lanati (nom. inval.)]|nr:hypothetical protein H8356DRAFT_923692 [Neocallimastix sp. JGI-2020a]